MRLLNNNTNKKTITMTTIMPSESITFEHLLECGIFQECFAHIDEAIEQAFYARSTYEDPDAIADAHNDDTFGLYIYTDIYDEDILQDKQDSNSIKQKYVTHKLNPNAPEWTPKSNN